MYSRGSWVVPLILAVLLVGGAVLAQLELSGDPRCLVMQCVIVKQSK